ncbi:MAG: hypothetical protein ACQGVK_11050 [Myxococcota bacterium]
MNPIQNLEVCWAAFVHGVRGSRRTLAVALAAALILAGPTAAWSESRSTAIAKDGGLGFGSALATVVYAPVKLVYATGGLIVGGLAWAFSGGDSEVAAVVFTPSLRGTYVLTPEHLKGKERIEFFGRDARQEDDGRTDVASAPDQWSSDW